MCYIENTKRNNRPQGGLTGLKVEIPPLSLGQSIQGWFFYLLLLTKRKNESKQCQKEYAKSQQILKIKIILIFHSITSIPQRIEVNTPCNTIVPCLKSYHILIHLSTKERHVLPAFLSAQDFISAPLQQA